ncbi:hypothetical protein FKM82_019360 [Ascaphus truei]
MVAFLSPTLHALIAGVEVWGSCSPLSAVTEPFLFLPLLLLPPFLGSHCPDLLLSSPCLRGSHLSPTFPDSFPFCLSLSL